MTDEIFGSYQVAQWRAAAGEVRYAFPAISVDEDGGNRVVERERAYRDGSKLDDVGAKAKRWTIEAKFENSIDEDGLAAINGSLVLYPEVINGMIDSFDRFHDAAGDLYVPTRGWVRARLDSYKRREAPDERDCATMTMTFVEDNEDSVDARTFTNPSAKANAKRLAAETTFDEQSDGMWSPDAMSINEFAAGLESWANAPGDYLAEVDQQAAGVLGSVARVEKAFSRPGGTSSGRDVLLDPESSATARKLGAMKEIAAQTKREAGRGKPPMVTVVFEKEQSLTSIAALLRQSFEDLLAANPGLNPAYIPAKTPVKVYGGTPSR